MQIPKHVAIIMDGNGRWAKKKKVPRNKGHRAGVEALRRTAEAALELGIEYLTFYAFSVDNWKRSKEEVDSLMDLMREYFKRQIKELTDKGIQIIVIGRIEKLPEDIQEIIRKSVKNTTGSEKLKVIIALNYGAREEITDGVKAAGKDLLKGKITLDDIDEELFSKYLYTKNIPDPDLFIRTSGEMRLSNFLLWQISYAELWITPVLWPDFDKECLIQAIEAYNSRERRFGGRASVQ